MTIHIDCKKQHGKWAYSIGAGEEGDLTMFEVCSDYEYDTEEEADRAAIKCLYESWRLYE